MSDYISRQAAIDALIAELKGKTESYWWDSGLNMYDVESVLKGLPSAQPEPIKINIEDFNKEDWERLKKEWGNTPITVLSEQPERKRGKWKRRLVDGGFNADWHCSECGWRTSLEEHGYNFCPHCGADMRGDSDE